MPLVTVLSIYIPKLRHSEQDSSGPPHFTRSLELNIEYQSRNKPISLTNSVFIPLYMPHTPHERLESLGRQSRLHHRLSHRGDRRGSRFDSPRQKYPFPVF